MGEAAFWRQHAARLAEVQAAPGRTARGAACSSTNISAPFQDLRKDQDFSDVTLTCDGDIRIEAHRVILAGSSKFFSRILKLGRLLEGWRRMERDRWRRRGGGRQGQEAGGRRQEAGGRRQEAGGWP